MPLLAGATPCPFVAHRVGKHASPPSGSWRGGLHFLGDRPLAVEDPAHAYLVVAFMEDATSLRLARNAVARLIRNLEPQGTYSITASRQQGLALLFGFELEADAAKLAKAVKAKPIGKYGGWKSQRGFLLDGRKYDAILKLAPAAPSKSGGRSLG